MTRWARSGSTQKHKKLPGEATKWGEFNHQNIKDSPNQHNEIKNVDSVEKNTKKGNTRFEASKHIRKNKFNNRSETTSTNTSLDTVTQGVKRNVVAGEKDRFSEKNQTASSSGISFDKQSGVSPRAKKKKCSLKNLQEDKQTGATSDILKKKKKEMHLKKLQQKRAKKGILLLPSKVERKLYNIKKKLREKGLPPHILKEIIRKERRKAELNFRKTFNPSKLCFNCRKPGHILADCPEKSGSSNQETGMCFKCGSEDHTSFRCPKKVQGFPFAKCFICKEQGHISKDCPKNTHGIYPKGGKCNLCGNVNHLKKDCPSLIKKKAEESDITLHTINQVSSIDEEVTEERKIIKKESKKKPKVVKF